MCAQYIRTLLNNAIGWVAENIRDFAEKPTYFSRRRKLPITTVLLYLLTAGCASSITELQKLFTSFRQTPSGSALSQQLAKLKPEAVQKMFFLFNEALAGRGGRPPKWRFLLCDGTRFNFSDKHLRSGKYAEWRHASGSKCLEGEATALYDMRLLRFVDAVIQPLHKINEYDALCTLIDRTKTADQTKTCFIGDRGFSSWNVLAHVQAQGAYFVFRSKDAATVGSVLRTLSLPAEGTYDKAVRVRLVRSGRLLQEAVPGSQTIRIQPCTRFDYIPARSPRSTEEFFLTFRVLCFKTDSGKLMNVITNLPSAEFPLRKIRQLYRDRWRIETAFGQLKCALAMESFHSHRPALIEQEIWAKLTAFNYVSAIRTAANRYACGQRRKTSKTRKYKYNVDFTYTCSASLAFLNPASPYYDDLEIIDHISRKMHAIRRKRPNPERTTPRRHTPVPLTHRGAL